MLYNKREILFEDEGRGYLFNKIFKELYYVLGIVLMLDYKDKIDIIFDFIEFKIYNDIKLFRESRSR